MSDFQQWASSDTAPWVPVNENFEALAGASLYAYDKDGSSGLDWGYMGGVFKDSTKTAGTTTLANNTTNYVVAHLTTGAISDATTTTNWDDDTTYGRVAKVTTSGGAITAVVDYRFDEFGLFAMLAGGGGGSGTPGGADTQVQFNDAGSFGGEAEFAYDKTNNILSVRRIHSGAVNGDDNGLAGDDPHWLNISNDPAVVAGGASAGFQLLRVNSYGSAGYGGNVHFCRYRGTKASPTAVQNGDTFMSFGIRGWDSGGALSQSAASWAAVATENWTGSAHGIKYVWQVTPNGSTTRANGMELASTGLTVAGTVTATLGVLGTKEVLQNSQSADYTTVLADSQKQILHPAADTNARTFTIAANASVAYPVGTAITFVNETSQVLSIAINSDTLTLANSTTSGTRSLAQNGVATALKVTSTKWIISGAGLT